MKTNLFCSYVSGGYCQNDTNVLLNKSATFDPFCSRNEILQTIIYIPKAIIAESISNANHFNKTIHAGLSENAKAYTHKQIKPNIISPKSVTQTFVNIRKLNGFNGKLR